MNEKTSRKDYEEVVEALRCHGWEKALDYEDGLYTKEKYINSKKQYPVQVLFSSFWDRDECAITFCYPDHAEVEGDIQNTEIYYRGCDCPVVISLDDDIKWVTLRLRDGALDICFYGAEEKGGEDE